MALFRAIVLAAALAGLLAGFVVSIAQQVGTVPLILVAEGYEETAPADAAHAHGHGTVREPQGGLERHLWTVVTNVITGVAFALLLVAGMALTGRAIGWREGLLWGLAGFAAFALAPSLGLPPQLPGTVAAPLEARQLWWAMTAAATAAGLGLLAWRRTAFWIGVAVILLLVPHLVGAPQPDEPWSAVPEATARQFVVAVLATSLIFWIVLGVLSALLFARFSREPRPLEAA